jgi:predicted deacylase
MHPFETNAELESLAASLGHPYRAIGSTLAGRDIICVRTGGDRVPAIMITAGAHGPEVSGVHAAMSLARHLQSEHAVYIVPNRDPCGLEGFESYMASALAEDIRLHDHSDVERILTTRGEVLYNQAGLLVALLSDLAFATMRTTEVPWSGCCYYIARALRSAMGSEKDLVEALRGKRVVLPANLPLSEGSRLFHTALTLYVTEAGTLTNLNRMFDHSHAPVEVACVRQLLDEVRPGLTLDLHEGFGSKFYQFVPTVTDFTVQELAKAIAGAVLRRGHAVSDLEELRPLFMTPEELALAEYAGDGIFVTSLSLPGEGLALSHYALRHGPSLTTETGLHNALANRVQLQMWAAQAALDRFEKGFA